VTWDTPTEQQQTFESVDELLDAYPAAYRFEVDRPFALNNCASADDNDDDNDSASTDSDDSTSSSSSSTAYDDISEEH
jgi:hypothetical protein